jgi:hypothetical protein
MAGKYDPDGRETRPSAFFKLGAEFLFYSDDLGVQWQKEHQLALVLLTCVFTFCSALK